MLARHRVYASKCISFWNVPGGQAHKLREELTDVVDAGEMHLL